jgi:hypothetical protein
MQPKLVLNSLSFYLLSYSQVLELYACATRPGSSAYIPMVGGNAGLVWVAVLIG